MSFDPRATPKTIEMTSRRHLGGFIGAGLSAFAVDSGLLALGTSVFGFDPLVARLVSVASAMVVAWLCHRRWTFALDTPATVREFCKFVGVAWIPSVVNYAVFGLTIAIWPQVWPQVALILATALATIVSYLSLRYGVFRKSSG